MNDERNSGSVGLRDVLRDLLQHAIQIDGAAMRDAIQRAVVPPTKQLCGVVQSECAASDRLRGLHERP